MLVTKTLGSGDQDTYLKSCMVNQEANRSISHTKIFLCFVWNITGKVLILCFHVSAYA